MDSRYREPSSKQNAPPVWAQVVVVVGPMGTSVADAIVVDRDRAGQPKLEHASFGLSEPDKPLSWHPSLPAQHIMGG